MIENKEDTMDGKEILNATERIVTLLRNLRPEELEAGITLKKDNQCPGIFGSQFDNDAYEEWHPDYTFPYAYRRFVVIDGGWESRDVQGPSVESLPLKWGVKKGDHLIMVTRNRPWGDGGVSWGTKWRLPKV